MNNKNAATSPLGIEPIGKLMVRLAVPTVLSQLVNMLYNIVDRIYIGNIPGSGSLALAGLGVCFPVIMIISAFAGLFGMGGAPKAAIHMGEGDKNKAEQILGNCVAALLITAAILTGFFILFGRDLLFVFGASEQIIDYAWDYLNIYVIGTVFVQLTLGLNPFINTQGFAKYGMTTVLIGAILNIILDPIFIFGFNMGVKGAATATIVSQAVSALWVLMFLFGKKSLLKLRTKNLVISSKILLPVMALGLSSFVMSSTESLLNISFNSSLQRYGGDLAVGAMTIIASAAQMCFLPLVGISQGSQPIISYNFGAGKMDRVRKTFKIQFITSITFSVIMWVMFLTVPQMFIRLFNNDPELIAFTTNALRIYMVGVFMLGAQIACQQTFLALGQAKASLFLAALRKLILLIPLIFILPMFFEDKVFAVFVAEPIADITSGIVTICTFAVIVPKTLKKREDELTTKQV